jgi:anti-sigma regulatory factor (Ser/Thr protein kinase)
MRRILVIGENPALSSLLRDSHATGPCEIESSPGEVEALQRLRERSFQVVVTDPKTPVSEDLALLSEMRGIRPGVGVVLLAPVVVADDVIAALRAQVFACFSVPFDPAEVASMVLEAAASADWRNDIEVLSARRDWIALRVACRLMSAERLVRFMTELRSDLPEEERSELISAFRELLVNAMEHGAGFNPEKVVEVTAVRTERAIVYYFRDPGAGFRRDALPHAAVSNTAANPLEHCDHRLAMGLRPGGFGILIAERIVDELIYNEIGNEVVMIKHTQ